MPRMSPNIDAFFDNAKNWQNEFMKLRNIVLETQLTEEFKWGKPCYSLKGKNIVLIHGFKNILCFFIP